MEMAVAVARTPPRTTIATNDHDDVEWMKRRRHSTPSITNQMAYKKYRVPPPRRFASAHIYVNSGRSHTAQPEEKALLFLPKMASFHLIYIWTLNAITNE